LSFSLAATTAVVSRAGVSCALASVIAPLCRSVSPAGLVSAAVVLLGHGVAEGVAACRREVGVEVPVLMLDVPLA
jgi:hypothetical protein